MSKARMTTLSVRLKAITGTRVENQHDHPQDLSLDHIPSPLILALHDQGLRCLPGHDRQDLLSLRSRLCQNSRGCRGGAPTTACTVTRAVGNTTAMQSPLRSTPGQAHERSATSIETNQSTNHSIETSDDISRGKIIFWLFKCFIKIIVT